MFSLLLLGITTSLVAPPILPAKQLPTRVGQLYIIGNDITSDGILLDCVKMYPGQTVSGGDKKAADRRLSGLRIFGIRAKCSLRDSGPGNGGSAYGDFVIKVEETWLTVLLLGPRSKMDALVQWTGSRVDATGTYCFGGDHPISHFVRKSSAMFQGAYHAAPTSTLLPFCAKFPLLAIGVHLFIGIPETLFVVAPVLESPSK